MSVNNGDGSKKLLNLESFRAGSTNIRYGGIREYSPIGRDLSIPELQVLIWLHANGFHPIRIGLMELEDHSFIGAFKNHAGGWVNLRWFQTDGILHIDGVIRTKAFGKPLGWLNIGFVRPVVQFVFENEARKLIFGEGQEVEDEAEKKLIGDVNKSTETSGDN